MSTPPKGRFVSVGAGLLHSCGLKTDGTVACWGSNEDSKGNYLGQSTPPVGTFTSVSVGFLHTCGIRMEGSVVCWGSNSGLNGSFRGQSTPPEGTFASISAGAYHTCVVKINGAATCWGWARQGQSTPPDGTFVSVSAGSLHSCGIKTDGTAVCWGGDDFGQSTIPGGLFVPVEDRAALVALYNATDGANWLSSRNWLSEAPLGEWYGVATDHNGSVTHLVLSLSQLKGEIPPELGTLASLTRLIFAVNQLTGRIPPELGSLTNLETLNLSSNQLDGAISPELGSLSNLKDLYLFRNRLSGAIPPELGSLTNLETLSLSSNQLSGAIPSELGKLVDLRTLNLKDNNLTGPIPPELNGLLRLKELYLGGSNQWSGCIPEGLRRVEKNDLETLGLPFCLPGAPSSVAEGWTVFVEESLWGHFQIEVPDGWEERDARSLEWPGWHIFEDPEGNGRVDIHSEGPGSGHSIKPTLEELAEDFASDYVSRSTTGGGEFIRREAVATARGLSAFLIEMWIDDGATREITLIHLVNRATAYLITYRFPSDQFEEGKELAYYSFDTFRVNR